MKNKKDLTKKLISELPDYIKTIALQRQSECNIEYYSKTTDDLREAFVWEHTDEKYQVWDDVSKGVFDSFYKLHGVNHDKSVAERYQPLFDLMMNEHGLTLTVSEMDDVANACKALYKVNLTVSENKASLSVKSIASGSL